MYNFWKIGQKFEISKVKVAMGQINCVFFFQHPLCDQESTMGYLFNKDFEDKRNDVLQIHENIFWNDLWHSRAILILKTLIIRCLKTIGFWGILHTILPLSLK